MAYQDLGFDEFLTRSYSNAEESQQLDPLAFDTFTDQISGSKVQGGVLSSPDAKTKLDLERGFFNINNGVEDLLRLGVLPDGAVGLLIKDNSGNILMQISAGKNFIRSPLGNFEVDLDIGRFVFYDETNTPNGVFGNV